MQGKPAPDVYVECLRRLGCSDPSRVLIVEDAVNGLLAAKAAGEVFKWGLWQVWFGCVRDRIPEGKSKMSAYTCKDLANNIERCFLVLCLHNDKLLTPAPPPAYNPS